MRSSFLAVASAVALLASGCAHTSETHESSMSMMSAPPPSQPQGEVIAVDQQAVQEEAPKARPRLTQTITLGQTNSESTYSPVPTPAAQGQGGNTQNVIVNNNVVVNQPAPSYGAYGGWGGYGGYGSYGYGYSGRGGTSGVRADGFGSRGGATWGNTGWEGARGRPATGGATPGVGGNWSSAPSHGPSQMR